MPRLLLENSAGTGDGIGAPLEDLADILDAAAAAGLATERLGVCLDTAHLWGAGYDLSGQAGVDELVGRIDEIVGPRQHRHAPSERLTHGPVARTSTVTSTSAGRAWPRTACASCSFTHGWRHCRPFSRRPGMDVGYDAVNLDRVRMLIEGETPAGAAAEAFEQRAAIADERPPEAR